MKTSLIFSALMFIGSFVIASVDPANVTNVDVTKSTITWTGKKVTGEHTGAVNLKSGNLIYKDGRIAGGSFEIDMNSITNSDMEGEWSDKLVGHLKSDDFFGVATYPTASLNITKVEGGDSAGVYNITADLTIKGQTHPLSFTAASNGNEFTANITVDRTLYDVKYGSGKFFEGLGDKMIYDDFELSILLIKS